jgi:Putative polyhydroxyalkanoic acid system protein (PHA_gran_rgn)
VSNPLFVSIPHHLGKDEAARRLKSGLSGARTNFAHLFIIQEETWTGNRLDFQVRALGQSVSGIIEVFDDCVNVQLVLPAFLATFAEALQLLIRKEGTLMLEKNKPTSET